MGTFIIAVAICFIAEFIYFKIAKHYDIVDNPSLRSSHGELTFRGGGIIFPIIFIGGNVFFASAQYFLSLGVFFIALVSFLDDILNLTSKLRIIVHFLSVLLLLTQIFINQNIAFTALYSLYALLFILCSLIIIIGIINAYNFMDGINGITVLYSLVTISTCLFIQSYWGVKLLSEKVFLLLIAALIVFGFFNLRRRAKSFAGDVGSISVALIISFLIGTLIMLTQDLKWILLLGIYGLDAVATIVCRLLRRENIFDAHRSHFYQFLANDKKWPHVLIASLYAFFQLLINLFLVFAPGIYLYLFFVFLTLLYIIFRITLEGAKRLFKAY